MKAWMLMVAALATGGAACKKEAPAVPPPAPTAAVAQTATITPDAGWLFTYATPEGGFETTGDPAAIPAGARAVVRAVNPAVPLDPAAARAGAIWVADLHAAPAGPAVARPMAREVFETRALAQLAPGASSALADAPSAARGPRPDGGAGAAPDPGTAAAGAAVTLYGTSWCGACQSARKYFVEKGIPFLDKDIERDEAAAAELRDKATRLGVAADRVPVLDVKGRLLIGFDPARIERILEESAI